MLPIVICGRQRSEKSSVVTEVALLALLVCTLAVTTAQPAEGSPLSRALTEAGFAQAYNLEFAACYDTFADAIQADPRDPAPRRAVAAVTWIETLFAQGVATFEAFTGEVSKGDVARPIAPPQLVVRFHRALEEAQTLAERNVAALDDADAHYQMGATAALAALYAATVEGRTLGALTQGRRAVSAMERARQRDRGKRETALVLGMSEYTTSTMSWPVRTLAKLSGLSGNRERALTLLEEAGAPGTETESDALLLLMIVDNREGRPADALRRLSKLQQRHPRNRLLWLNQGAAALAAKQPSEAERVLSLGIDGREADPSPDVRGEVALWLAHRATARTQLHRNMEAESDLQRGLSSGPRDWVRGRIHAQLGDLKLAAGARTRAQHEFEAAVEFSGRGGDRAAVTEARRKLDRLKRQQE